MADFNEESLKFGIEQTMELGDSASILDEIADEGFTNEPIEKINPPAPEKKTPAKPSGKKEPEEEEEEKVETPSAESIINSFLGGEESEDDDDGEEKSPKPKKPLEEEEESTSPFEAFAKDLFKLGVFSKDEDEEDDEIEIKTAEQFLERFNSEKKKGAIEIVNNFIGQFGEDYQDAFQAIYVKGVNPKDYFGIYNSAVSFASLDLTQESNQELVVRKALQDQGFEEEDIVSEIERLKSYADLETVASKHHKVLVKKESAKLKELEGKAEKELQQKMALKEHFRNSVNSVLQEKLKTKEFDGIPINPKLVTELQDFLLVDRWKTASGETLTDFDRALLDLKKPENHQMKVKIALLIKILEKDPTLSTIQKSGVTKQTNTLFGEVARQASSKGNKTGVSQGSGKDVFAQYLNH